MKYNLNINQFAIIEQGLDIDLYDAAILNFVSDWLGNSSATIVNYQGQPFTWISHSLIIKQIPMLRTRTKNGMKPMGKDTVYRRMKRLCEIGLLQIHPESKVLGMSLYRGTAKLDSIKYGAVSAPTDINPMGYGYKSDGATDTNPNYNTIKDNSINNTKKEEAIKNCNPPFENQNNQFKDSKEEKEKEKSCAKKEKLEDLEYYQETIQILALFTELTGVNFKPPKSVSNFKRYGAFKMVKSLLKQGFKLREIEDVIKFKCKEWLQSSKMARHCTYKCILLPSNFENYITQIQIKPQTNGKQTNNTNNKTFTDIFAEIDARYQQEGYDPTDCSQSAGPF